MTNRLILLLLIIVLWGICAAKAAQIPIQIPSNNNNNNNNNLLKSLQMPSVRPSVEDRLFVSEVVDNVILDVGGRMEDRDLATLFSNCYPNTLDTTVYYTPNGSSPDTFVITGDIIAMWLRDSSAQVSPYLRYANEDEKLLDMIVGVLNRQSKQVQFDPWANAHHRATEGRQWLSDSTTKLGFLNIQLNAMLPELHERKYELDSLAYFMKLATSIYEITNGTRLDYYHEEFIQAFETALDVIVLMQESTMDHKLTAIPYTFLRETSRSTDTLLHGVGHPGKRTGMSRSPFRPSDDATTLPFLVPSNAFAAVQLRRMVPILNGVERSDLATRANAVADEIEAGIYTYAIYNHPTFGDIFAWEVDGFGNYYLGDDANVPSLLSLPYLGFVSSDNVIYQNTRRFLLSDSNPWMNRGSVAEGIGGPHPAGAEGRIWSMSIIMQALTSNDDDEIAQCLEWIKASSGNTGVLHESFWKDDANNFSRAWFAWVNGLFGELILKVADERPHLIF